VERVLNRLRDFLVLRLRAVERAPVDADTPARRRDAAFLNERLDE